MTSPRRVLMTADAVGGVWTYAVDLAHELTACGIGTTLAVQGPEPSPEQEAQAHASGAELIVLGGPLDWTAESPAEVDAAALRLAFTAARVRPDIVHLNSPAMGANVRFAAPVVAVAHSCVSTWWMAVRGAAPLPADLAWRADLVRRGYMAADALIAPSQAFALHTQAAYGLTKSPRVVPNGRPPFVAASESPIAPARSVFTAGRLWDEGKDVVTLDRAAARLDVDVVAAGGTSNPNGGEAMFDALQVLGVIEPQRVEACLSRRPIFVSTSVYEPFGLAVLEAAQAGCPLVLSDIDTFRELWGDAAVFFPPGDDRALARELQALLEDDARRTTLGEQARTRARGYSAEGMATGVRAIYAEVAAARAGERHVA